MSKLLKSRDYLRKCLGFVFLLGFISLGTIIGCTNNGGEQKVLTEKDFAGDKSLFANPRDGVVITFVEPPDSDVEDYDTGEKGVDIIPYRSSEDLNHTYCFDDENESLAHSAILRDDNDNEVLSIKSNAPCVTKIISAGYYFLEITPDEDLRDTFPLFAIPGQKGVFFEEQAAQIDIESLSTLLHVNVCDDCYLRGVDLSETNLIWTYLVRTDLSHANLSNANLSHSNYSYSDLSNANLSNANLSITNMNHVNLSHADLSGANLSMTNLSHADLSGANLSNADLSMTNLSNANLSMTNLSHADLSGARWCDGDCICDTGSIGTCVGCEPIADVCGDDRAAAQNGDLQGKPASGF